MDQGEHPSPWKQDSFSFPLRRSPSLFLRQFHMYERYTRVLVDQGKDGRYVTKFSVTPIFPFLKPYSTFTYPTVTFVTLESIKKE
jgi:hypothetical protein